MLLSSCNHQGAENSSDNTLLEDSKYLEGSTVSMLEKELEDACVSKDSLVIFDCWSRFRNLDSSLFEYYIVCYQNSSWGEPWSISLGNKYLINTHGGVFSIESDPRLNSLYLLTSLFYDDFYFAILPSLYDTTEIYFNDSTDLYLYDGYLGMTSSKEMKLERAWKFLDEWYKSSPNKDLKSLRQRKRPLPTDLFWFGEKDGLINKNTYLLDPAAQ